MVEIRLLVQSVLILIIFAFNQVGFWLLFGQGQQLVDSSPSLNLFLAAQFSLPV
jgi:hypothetical protein